MSSTVLLEAQGLRKSFPKVATNTNRIQALWDVLLGNQPAQQTTVLSGVNLRIVKGQSTGIIGQNGAGKSSLLKLLSGVWTPSEGSVNLHGSVAALLELGAGFHPDYSGRDNIQLSGLLLGFSANEIREKMAEIEAFADIGAYIDEPVKHYSSGMVVRLGFALVAARKPDLLITDEVLAVGDESFQRKCIRWMEEYLAQGGTLLLVSHSMYHVQKLCTQAIWIHDGKIAASGEVYQVTQQYLAWQEKKIAAEADAAQRGIEELGEFSVQKLSVNGVDSLVETVIAQDDSLTVNVHVLSKQNRGPVLALGITRLDGTAVYGVTSEMDQFTAKSIGEKTFEFTCQFHALPLLPGTYLVRAHAMDSEGLRLFDTVERTIVINGASREMGFVRLSHTWN